MKRYVVRLLVAVAAGAAVWLGYTQLPWGNRDDELGAAGIVGVQHLGKDYPVSEFYINNYAGGKVGRDGGGGGIVCCVMIPLQWRPGLTVDVRWRVEDWSHENRTEIKAGDYRSVSVKGFYIAKVPVEKYDDPGDVYVHFFPRGRVRVVSTMHSVLSRYHPVPYGPTDGGAMATAGWPVKELFTEAELRARERGNPWK